MRTAVLAGQVLFLPEGFCRADEATVIDTLAAVNQAVLTQMTYAERETVAEAYQLLDNAASGGGIVGGFAGGAVAGLACGPGAPVCVTIGAFAGGALAAFGIATFW